MSVVHFWPFGLFMVLVLETLWATCMTERPRLLGGRDIHGFQYFFMD